jgi:hypothetical protein
MLCAPPQYRASEGWVSGMLRSTVGKVIWVERATVSLVGLAPLFGVTTTDVGKTASRSYWAGRTWRRR